MNLTRFRMIDWLLITLVLIAVVYAVNPYQLTVMLLKASMLTLYGTMGYWFDRSVFPAARPDDPALCHTGQSWAGVRRALIILAFVLGGSLGA